MIGSAMEIEVGSAKIYLLVGTRALRSHRLRSSPEEPRSLDQSLPSHAFSRPASRKSATGSSGEAIWEIWYLQLMRR